MRAAVRMMARRGVASAAGCTGNRALREVDPEMQEILDAELERQAAGLELIASENFTSRHVMDCMGSVATNKYAEGYPGARYYGGTEVVDRIENLCRERALEAYRLNPSEWGVNVQPYSGSIANLAALSAVLNPRDRLMGLDLPSGGHLSHGFYTRKRKVSATSIFYESLPYSLNAEGYVDYDALRKTALVYQPKLIIAGGSAYPREWDYKRYRAICDEVGAKLLMDMAHISGLVAAREAANPFEVADVVTTTTHKTLRGPRAGLVFWRKSTVEGVDDAVFPMIQGGPHMHKIAAVAAQLKEVMSPEFTKYIRQVKANAAAMGDELMRLGYTLMTSGTDNHLLLIDLKPHGLTGSKCQNAMDAVCITVNKNSIIGDKSAMNPGGIRVGTSALTSRGMVEQDLVKVAGFVDRTIKRALQIQKQSGPKLADFTAALEGDAELGAIRAEVVAYALSFPFPGLPDPFPVKSS